MSLYTYIREERLMAKKAVNYLSYVILSFGALLLFWAFYPVVSFEIYSRLYIEKNIISPVSYVSAAPLGFTSQDPLAQGVYASNLKDFTQASLWFPQAPKIKKVVESKPTKITKESAPSKPTKSTKQPQIVATVKEYTISIPKLNIDHAMVQVGGEDLTKGLVHFMPTSMPGQPGNVAIFGHSTLPQLYNSKNYKSIFTYLPQLERGDKIIVSIGGTDYEYDVGDMYVVKPENLSPIEQRYDGSYLTLVTCVPPGTYWNRLVLKAKLKTVAQAQVL